MKQFRLSSPRLKENDVEQACLDLLRYRGYYPIRQHSGLVRTPDGRWMRLGEPGLPDWAAVHERYPGFMFECKRPGGRLSAQQQIKIRELQAAYHLEVAIVDDVKAFADWLDWHERRHMSLVP